MLSLSPHLHVSQYQPPCCEGVDAAVTTCVLPSFDDRSTFFSRVCLFSRDMNGSQDKSRTPDKESLLVGKPLVSTSTLKRRPLNKAIRIHIRTVRTSFSTALAQLGIADCRSFVPCYRGLFMVIERIRCHV